MSLKALAYIAISLKQELPDAYPLKIPQMKKK